MKRGRRRGKQGKTLKCTYLDDYEFEDFESEGYWIEDLLLLPRDKEILEEGGWLNASLINAGQHLLSQQFPKLSGLQDVSCGLTMSFQVEDGIFVQILHDPSGHWLTVSTIKAEPSTSFVYDSLYARPSAAIQQQVACLLKSQSNIELKLVDVHLQSGASDCGLFALAFATALAYGHCPGSFVFDQRQMRQHFAMCREARNMTMFPILRDRRSESRVKYVCMTNVHCICRMPRMGDEPMIQCTACGEWYHGTICIEVPSSAWNPNTPWVCPPCSN